MEALKRYVVVAAALLLCAFALSSTTVVRAVADKVGSVFVSNDVANAVPVLVTNGERAPSSHVTVVHLAPSNAGYRQQFADGSSAGADFAIPPGQVLVVTDIEVTFRRGAAAAGQTASYFLQSTDATVPGQQTRARLQATLNAEGNGADTRHLQTGIVFAATNSLTDSLPAINTFDVAVLRGYLTADR